MVPSSGKTVILVAEDEAVVRNVVTTALKRAGYEVLAAVDGVTALELSRAYQGTIHLLLSDVCMPNLEGPALARTLVEERPGIRVLLMTGKLASVIQGSWPEPLQKPFRPGHLVERVAEVLSRWPE